MLLSLEFSLYEITKTILEIFHDEIDFDVKNLKQETIAHKLAFSYDFKRFIELSHKFPKLLEAFKRQIDFEDHERMTPLKFLIQGWRWKHQPQFEVILNTIGIEKIRKNFHLFVNHVEGLQLLFEKLPELFEDNNINELLKHIESNEAFDYFLTKISTELFSKISENESNFLHLIFVKNSATIVDLTIKFLSEDQLKKLLQEKDNEGRKPFYLLNDDNKTVFQILKDLEN